MVWTPNFSVTTSKLLIKCTFELTHLAYMEYFQLSFENGCFKLMLYVLTWELSVDLVAMNDLGKISSDM